MSGVQRIAYVHGGMTYRTDDEYRQSLARSEITLERLRATRDWKDRLEEVLGPAFEVYAPRMPLGGNARYKDWELYFSRCLPLFGDGIVLIGHSLGGVFLARYLAEHESPVRINATLLVAAPYGEDAGEYLGGFVAPASLATFAARAGQVFLYHSTDDPVVPYEHVLRYAKALPDAVVRTETSLGHCNAASFPRLEADLRGLAA